MKISTDGRKSEPCDLEALEQALREIDGKCDEFVILENEEGHFIQVRFEDTFFVVEYQAGSTEAHYQRPETDLNNVVSLFRMFFDGDEGYRSGPWKRLELPKSSKSGCVFVLALLGMAALGGFWRVAGL